MVEAASQSHDIIGKGLFNVADAAGGSGGSCSDDDDDEAKSKSKDSSNFHISLSFRVSRESKSIKIRDQHPLFSH